MIWLLTFLCLGLCALAVPKESERKCPVCGKPPRPRFKYCPVCWPLVTGREHDVPVAERIRALRDSLDEETGVFRCYYTNLVLNLCGPGSPFYLTFDHMDPREKRLVVCAKFVNDMKKDLTRDEFCIVIPALSDHFEKGVPLDPGLIGFVCWPGRFSMPPPPPYTRTPPSPKGCKICQMTRRPYSLYCNRCRYFIWHKPEHTARADAMILSWDPEKGGFVCWYSGVLLDYTNKESPWYITFDHRIPGKKGNMVACAAWINYMKSDLTDGQFRRVLKGIADHFREGRDFDPALLGP